MSRDAVVAVEEGRAVWPFALNVALFGQLMNWVSVLGYAPLLPAMQQDWGLTFTQVGFFTGLMGVMGILVSVPFGLFAGRYGTKAGALVGLGCVAAGLGLLVMAEGFVVAIVGRAVWTAGYRGVQIALFAATAYLTPKRAVSSMMGVTFALANLAAVIGAPMAGFIATGSGWRVSMEVFIGLTMVAFLILLVLFRPAAIPSTPHEAAAPGRPQPAEAYRNRTVWLLALLLFLNTMSPGAIVSFAPLAMTQQFKSSAADVGNVISLGFAIGIPLVTLAGILADRWGARKWMVAGANVPIVALALLLVVPDARLFAFAAVSMLTLSGVSIALVHAMPASLLSGRQLGPAFAIVTMGASVQAFVGPQLRGILRDATGSFNAGWYLVAAGTAISVVVVSLLKAK